jgi:hypothetical protein
MDNGGVARAYVLLGVHSSSSTLHPLPYCQKENSP